MNPRLEGKAAMSGFERSGLFKIGGLEEFAAGHVPPERLILDVRRPEVKAHLRALSTLRFAGVLVDDVGHCGGLPWIDASSLGLELSAGDVIEVHPSRGRVARRYQRGARGNILFATERCNSFCLMCSQPPREVTDAWRAGAMMSLIDLIDTDAPILTVTGGEPTLLGGDLVDVLEHAASRLPDTDIRVLSNGRNFADAAFAMRFAGIHPRLSWGVPLYGDHFGLHDYVVQRQGAFQETIRGLYALHAAGQSIEIRVVLVRPVAERIEALARYLYRAFPFASHVALMGVEPTGFAKAHRETLWIDPIDFSQTLSRAVQFLARRGMAVSIYNLPLCTLPPDIRPFAVRSISDWKQSYLPACNKCAMREACGGFFAWTTGEWTSRAIAPITEMSPCTNH